MMPPPINPLILAVTSTYPTPSGRERGDQYLPTPQVPPHQPIGRTFLLEPQEDGQHFHARIMQAIQDHDAKRTANAEWFKFRCSINDDQFEEILSYSKILNYIEQQDDPSTKLWQIQPITGHEGCLLTTERLFWSGLPHRP